MNIEQFLEVLSKTPRGWYFRSEPFEGEVRLRVANREFTCCCPLSACTAEPMSEADFDWAATELDIDEVDMRSIVAAADNDTGHDPALRARLLTACGLADPK